MFKPFVWIVSEHPTLSDKKHAIRELIFTLALSMVLLFVFEILHVIDESILFNLKHVSSVPGFSNFSWSHLTVTGYVIVISIIISEILDVVLLALWLINLKVSKITLITFAIIILETTLSLFYWIILSLFGIENIEWLTLIKTLSTIGIGIAFGLVVMMHHRVSNHIFI